MAEKHGLVHGVRGGDERTAGGGSGGMPPGDANNANASGGYRHWHELGTKKPPGGVFRRRKRLIRGAICKQKAIVLRSMILHRVRWIRCGKSGSK